MLIVKILFLDLYIQDYLGIYRNPAELPYLFYSILLGLAISIVGRLFLLDSVWKLFASILFAGFAYLIILLIFERKSIFKDAIKVYKLILK